MRGFVLALGAALALALACGESPKDDYQAWRGRTRSFRGDGGVRPAQDGGTFSQLADLRGRWLLNSLLFGGIEVGLRIILDGPDGEDGPPQALTARIWLWDMPEDSAPLVETTTTVDDLGRFQLVADPLDLPGSVINRDDPVQALVILNSRTLGPETWCGVAEGSVQRPLTLPLAGSTFAARRDVDPNRRLNLTEVPFRCPDDPEPPAPDAGVEEDGGPRPRPESPDLSAQASAYADLTGDWLFTADFVIPLQLWISLRAIPGASGGSLDGALRSVRAEPGEPALATFTAQVDADGRFEIWLPDFTLAVGGLAIEADILLAAVTTGDGFCGAAAGAIRQPAAFAQDLDGTPYRAIRWAPGDSVAGAPNACPE